MNNFDLNTLNIKREFDNAMIDIERANYYPTLAFLQIMAFREQQTI